MTNYEHLYCKKKVTKNDYNCNLILFFTENDTILMQKLFYQGLC